MPLALSRRGRACVRRKHHICLRSRCRIDIYHDFSMLRLERYPSHQVPVQHDLAVPILVSSAPTSPPVAIRLYKSCSSLALRKSNPLKMDPISKSVQRLGATSTGPHTSPGPTGSGSALATSTAGGAIASKIGHVENIPCGDEGKFSLLLDDSSEAHLLYKVRQMAETPAPVLDLVYCFTPERFRGLGVAGSLAEHAFDWARERGYSIRPSCSYVADDFVPNNAAKLGFRYDMVSRLCVPIANWDPRHPTPGLDRAMGLQGTVSRTGLQPSQPT